MLQHHQKDNTRTDLNTEIQKPEHHEDHSNSHTSCRNTIKDKKNTFSIRDASTLCIHNTSQLKPFISLQKLLSGEKYSLLPLVWT